MSDLPSVDVVVPTHNRPELMRAAVASVVRQNYAGKLRVIVVYDAAEPDHSLASSGGAVDVTVLANARTSGLSGARNTGILAGEAEYVAFLDDDDTWLVDKLAKQMHRLLDEPNAFFATTAIEVDYDDERSLRTAGTRSVNHVDLVRSRMAMLHSSTFLIRREALLTTLGLVAEDAPRGQNEDWDLLLRASALSPIAHLDVPLVRVRWGRTSMFSAAWASRVEGANWILQRHPDIASDRVGYARLLGQIAFGRAAIGERRGAARDALRAARTRLREPRSYLALAVAAGAVKPDTIQRALHRHGHGI